MAEIIIKDGSRVSVDVATETKLIIIISDPSRISELLTKASDGYYNSYAFYDDDDKYVKTINHFTNITTTPYSEGRFWVTLHFKEDEDVYTRLLELENENAYLREYAEAGRIMFGESSGGET